MGQGRQGTYFPTGHIRYTTVISLGSSNLGGKVGVADVRQTWIQDNQKKLHVGLL